MKSFTFKAFVLRSQRVGKSDRLLTLLSASRGLLTAFANGASRPQSKLLSLTQPYSLCEFQIRAGRDSFTVLNGELIYAFLPLREDFALMSEADRLSKLFADASRHDIGQKAVYELYGRALYALCRSDKPVFTGALASCRLLGEIGFAPWVGDCVVCHQSLDAPFVFDCDESGLCCPLHAGSSTFKLPSAVVSLLHHVESAVPERLFAIDASESVAAAFIAFVDHYVEMKMERRYERFLPPDPGSLFELCKD
jgi:DNA repair protein RecO (recombination protein O)